MPRSRKLTPTDKAEIQPIIPQEEPISITTPVINSVTNDTLTNKKAQKKITKAINLETPIPVEKMTKEHFKQLHTKDTFWLENDIYQTIADRTEGKKGAKALLINQALKDYCKKHKMELTPLRAKEKKV